MRLFGRVWLRSQHYDECPKRRRYILSFDQSNARARGDFSSVGLVEQREHSSRGWCVRGVVDRRWWNTLFVLVCFTVIQGNSVNGFSENRSRSLRWHDTGIIPRVCRSYRVPLMVSELPNVLQTPQIHWTTLFMISNKFGGRDDDDDETFVNVDDEFCPTDDEDDSEDQVLGEELDTASVVVEDIHWRVAKLRLEEQNTRRFLKSRPRFLPYNECRKWVQALGRFQTEEDWKEWISMGEKRNSYIPVRDRCLIQCNSRFFVFACFISHCCCFDHACRVVRTNTMDDWVNGSAGTIFSWKESIVRERIVTRMRSCNHIKNTTIV